MTTAARTPVIAGIGLSDYPIAPHLTAPQHHAQAMQRALADCGMPKQDLDGYVSAGTGGDEMTVQMTEYLGIRHRYVDSTMTGGSAFEFHMQHAAAAIRDGLADAILVTYGSNQLSRMGRMLGTGGFVRADERVLGPSQFTTPFGLPLVGCYAMAAARHMHEYGTTSEQLAEIAVGVREFAGFNPLARYRGPLTVDDVLASRMIVDPLHLLDCCVITDGGGAVVVTSEERARDLKQKPVYILGAAGGQTHWNIDQMPDFTEIAAMQSGPEAMARAGVGPDDIDTLQLYDSFTITVLLMLEGLGFCAKGEGGAFVAEGNLRRGGRFPTNTDGGGLSSNHPGMRGMFLLIEAVRQLRGQAGEAQVPDAEVALCCGSGGFLSCIGTVVLGNDQPREERDAMVMDVVRGEQWTRPIPNGEAEYGEFYAACADGRLLVQRCPACDHRQFYPRPVCTRCAATPEWLECAGTGTVHTFTIVRQYRAEPFGSELPYALVIVDLPEGPRMFGRLTGVEVDDVRIGLPVEAYTIEFEAGRTIAQWRPIAVR